MAVVSISTSLKVAAAVVEYFTKGIESYYFAGLNKVGEWFGSAVAKLGLAQRVDPTVFKNLLDGYSPDRHRALVQNAGKFGRQTAWDLTFNADKSISVLWALSPAGARTIIEEVYRKAVRSTLNYAEQTCGLSRRGKGGMIEEPASLLFFLAEHAVSRGQQPHLHTHALLLNVGLRQDGTTGSLVAREFFRRKMELGAMFQAELAAGLRERLGLCIVQERVGFHIDGVPRELCRAFSARRQQIEQKMNERGQQGAVAAKIAALDTRPKKQELSPTELNERWQQVGKQFGWGQEQALKLIHIRGPEMEPARKTPNELSNQPAAVATEKGTFKQTVELRSHFVTKNASITPRSEDEPKTRPLKIKQPKFHVEWRRLCDKTPWIPAKERLISTEWRPIFPNAAVTPLRKLQLPVLVVALPRLVLGPHKQYKPRWWSITYKRDLVVGELRMQHRMLFPNAPKWSPFHGLSDCVIRFAPQKSKWQPMQHGRDFGQELSY